MAPCYLQYCGFISSFLAVIDPNLFGLVIRKLLAMLNSSENLFLMLHISKSAVRYEISSKITNNTRFDIKIKEALVGLTLFP